MSDELPIMLWASMTFLTRVLLSWAKRNTNSKTWQAKQTRDLIDQQLTKANDSGKTWQLVQIMSMKIRNHPKISWKYFICSSSQHSYTKSCAKLHGCYFQEYHLRRVKKSFKNRHYNLEKQIKLQSDAESLTKETDWSEHKTAVNTVKVNDHVVKINDLVVCDNTNRNERRKSKCASVINIFYIWTYLKFRDQV